MEIVAYLVYIYSSALTVGVEILFYIWCCPLLPLETSFRKTPQRHLSAWKLSLLNAFSWAAGFQYLFTFLLQSSLVWCF